MHPLTHKIVGELDLLYGLYQLAVDLVKRIEPGNETLTFRVLEARNRILDKTAVASKEATALLKAFREEPFIPANERALVEEKRNLILDLGTKMQAADGQVLRAMRARLAGIRREMADQTHRKNAIMAYIRAPAPSFAVK